ncbi:hypothetical protein PYCCODRAFT_1410600 [Trametes coccinea BRFM310]|uniref:Ubiquitin-like protease family profile domain-containing protein n=1 Tax=Trametes coccinea (strain BRFM310) TaxID=1353009 RepID=A0A1Y2IND4_TRAC3|nr:hypothetical protein PYCCODRAFT_1410600 [Trametes coccinea BRFM310]
MEHHEDLPVLSPPSTPTPKLARREEQPVGKHFMTPERRRRNKDAGIVPRPDLALRFDKLNSFMDDLMKIEDTSGADAGPSQETADNSTPPEVDPDITMEETYAAGDVAGELTSGAQKGTYKRFRPRPEDSLRSLHASWLETIPIILDDYLNYLRASHSRTARFQPDWAFSCPAGKCFVETTQVLCLHFEYPLSVECKYCECRSITQVLVSKGLFPTSPTQPRVAISIDLLDFYFALFERSADAVSALASALKTFYQRRGFPILGSNGEPVQDPFRRGMSNAIQWYDHLRQQHRTRVEGAIDCALTLVDLKVQLDCSGESASESAAGVNAPPAKTAETNVADTQLQRHVGEGNTKDADTSLSAAEHQRDAPVTTSVDVAGVRDGLCDNMPDGVRDHTRDGVRDGTRQHNIPKQRDISAQSGSQQRPGPPAPYVTTETTEDVTRKPADTPKQPRNASPSKVKPQCTPQAQTAGNVVPALINAHTLVAGQCHRILQKRCPACFGGNRFGRSFEDDGGDIHVAMDATFSQRHNAAAGDRPWHYVAEYFISKEQVDAVGERIAAARKKAPKTFSTRVPEAALDECQKSFEAADEKKEKTSSNKFDDTGLMALVCRHDIVLFLANVDTPGEQQKYAIALLEHLYSLLPDSATVAAFYDIGCVLDRSVHTYDILTNGIVERLIFATSVMHAYGHQWACQLVYNPRLREGLGLSEGEGTERVWSQFRILIGVTRTSGRERRVWILDQHAKYVNEKAREELGAWIRSRFKNGVEAREAVAMAHLLACGVSTEELRAQWSLQQSSQLASRPHAPARLKRELDSVLSLQAELDTIEKHLSTVQDSILVSGANPISQGFVDSLRRSHAHTVKKVEEFYVSLNVTDHGFPELKNLPLEFVRTLLIARDLKINIRKRAIGSFFEWDKLDRAAGGRDQPLGTKLHQQTRKAIAKRTPALMTAIRKFNTYCDTLKTVYNAEWNFPLPQHLPTELGALREDTSLLTDVWITPTETDMPPRWLDDPQVRSGIRALLNKDRCQEERRRLGQEADNLCRWYGRELAAVELALRMPQNSQIAFLLQQKKDELLLLKARWRTPFVSNLRFDAHTRRASQLALQLSGIEEAPPPLAWIHLPVPDDSDGLQEVMEEEGTFDVLLACDTLEQLVGDLDIESSIPEIADFESNLVSQPPATTLGQLSGASYDYIMGVQRTLILTTLDPDNHLVDSTPLPSFPRPIHPVNPNEALLIPATEDFVRIIIPGRELRRLEQREAWLSDDCINGGMQALLRYYGTSLTYGGAPALLSSRVFSLHCSGASDDALWRDCRGTRLWTKRVWIMPIHRQQPNPHWTLAVVYWDERKIAYFDSLADSKSWEADVPAVYSLMYKLHRIANEKGCEVRLHLDETSWETYLLADSPLQSNGYDCGIWVLACVAALLRGYHSVQLTSSEISYFRGDLLCLLRSLVV